METITVIFGWGANQSSKEFELASAEDRQTLKNHIYEHVKARDDVDQALVNAIFFKENLDMNCYTFVTHDSLVREVALMGSGNAVFVEERSNSEQDIVEFVEDLFKKSSFKSLSVASSCLGVIAKTFSKL